MNITRLTVKSQVLDLKTLLVFNTLKTGIRVNFSLRNHHRKVATGFFLFLRSTFFIFSVRPFEFIFVSYQPKACSHDSFLGASYYSVSMKLMTRIHISMSRNNARKVLSPKMDRVDRP